MPVEDGSAGQVLKTDGNGNLSWVTPATTNGITVAEKWHLNGNFNVTSASTYMVVHSTQGYWSKSGSG